jgi:hypothetical protein
MTHNPTSVRPERTGWRDEAISKRHRMWGFNCPAVDLDFLMVEYNLGEPVGLIEYKHEGAQKPNLLHPTYRAIMKLADLASLPFCIVLYNNTDWWFKVTPVNERAKAVFAGIAEFSELEFVSKLYEMRSRVIETEVLSKLNTTRPVEHWTRDDETRCRFWKYCGEKLGLTTKEVLQALNVRRLEDYTGSKQDAIDALNKYVNDRVPDLQQAA